MSKVVRLNIIEQKLLSNPEVYHLLSGVIEKIREKEGNVPLILSKTFSYVEKHSKIRPEEVQSAISFLKGLGFKDETIVMIINICPKTVDELRILLDYEERYIEENTLKEVVEYMKNVCLK
ncbi:DNA-directed RNA polymerase subunit F [Thermogladius sp. 4427co]|uniref:DNA-directed RNA polymerase subunit F n=1 Tax=Thermogladius sp. 4427co TaxID=3450718 RepID=UPI003F78D751